MSRDAHQTTIQLVKKESVVLRQKWLHHIPIDFVNITKNTRVCIKHFEEKDIHTYNIHTNPDGSTYRVSKIIYY